MVDKAPLNFKWIGLIMKIFPDSKIIHCTRSPMDICWSNYKNTFSSRSMNYTYDFADLVNFYKLYDDLMNFWQKKFDKKIFNMNYENLIANKEVETKRLIKFAHSLSLKIHVWTINDEETMQELINLGVDGIITDRPKLLKDVLSRN